MTEDVEVMGEALDRMDVLRFYPQGIVPSEKFGKLVSLGLDVAFMEIRRVYNIGIDF